MYLDYSDEKVAYFRECPENCKVCIKGSESRVRICLACKKGWLVLEGFCVEKCGTFHLKSNRCELKSFCGQIPSCLDCLVTTSYFSIEKYKGNNCKLCQTRIPFTLRYQLETVVDSNCSRPLPPVLIVKENDCTTCVNRCVTCGTEGRCLECKEGYFLTNQGGCRRSCSEGFYPDANSKNLCKLSSIMSDMLESLSLSEVLGGLFIIKFYMWTG